MKCQGYEFEDDQLTFAEAMALDPSEVEVSCPEDHCWGPLPARIGMTLTVARAARFRRARPKLSRVQEMVDNSGPSTYASKVVYRVGLETAIRAVCEYLRTKREAANITVRSAIADDIECEFLEER